MSNQPMTCDGNLLCSLIEARPEEVDVLVDTITDTGTGRTGLDSGNKVLLVHAKYEARISKKYDEKTLRLLASELQDFGGNSAVNLARRLFGKSAVPYAEIVDDVYRKLNGKPDKNATWQAKEREIALALFGANCASLSERDRRERSNNALVISGFFDMKKALSTGSTGTVIGLSSAASAALFVGKAYVSTVALGIYSAASEAYRVTIPFVAQMGWIRLRREIQARTPLPYVPTASEPTKDTKFAPGAIVVVDEKDSKLMTFEVAERQSYSEEPSFNRDQISPFNILLSAVPGLAALAELQSSHYVVCSLPYDVLVKSSGGDGALGWVAATNGRIQEQARFSIPEGMQNMLTAGAVWNVASVLVAQKHLADISEKLSQISKKLDQIISKLDQADIDTFNGLYSYVISVHNHSQIDGIPTQSIYALESKLSDLVTLANKFIRKIKHELEHAKGLKTEILLDATKSRGDLLKSLAEVTNWIIVSIELAKLTVVANSLLYRGQALARYRQNASDALNRLDELPALAAECHKIYPAQLELSNYSLFGQRDEHQQQLSAGLAILDGEVQHMPKFEGVFQRSLFDRPDAQILLRFENGCFTEGHLLPAQQSL